jgi:hypothetical protein
MTSRAGPHGCHGGPFLLSNEAPGAVAAKRRIVEETGPPPRRSVWFGRLIDIARLGAQFSDHCGKGT